MKKEIPSNKKQLRPHQTSAKTKVGLGFENSDRGKLIMACGTGKTFTSLKIAEEIAGKNKLVLFLGGIGKGLAEAMATLKQYKR
jgi:predicted helicase